MSRLSAVTHRDVNHKQCFNLIDSDTALCVVSAAVICDGEKRTVDKGSERKQVKTTK